MTVPPRCIDGNEDCPDQPLLHGGRLGDAVRRYGRPREQWLDLSTGINPNPWPVPAVPATHWQRLPETGDGLEAAAADYYGCASLLPVAGSQAAIQALPQLRSPCRVGIIEPGYAEHRAAWARAGHTLESIGSGQLEQRIEQLQVLVLINPNNPGAEQFDPRQLLAWRRKLCSRGGWLVVDEAFIDSYPQLSLAGHCPLPGLILLRSVGKFFGLAGIRCGFVLAEPPLLRRLERQLGPWTVTGPSRYLCRHALTDRRWQQATRRELPGRARRLKQLLQQELQAGVSGTHLFQTLQSPLAGAYHETLARQGILTRLFAAQQLLRFGLPADQSQWQRLQQALTATAAIHSLDNTLSKTRSKPDT